PTPTPAAPTSLTGTAASSSQINLAWVDNSSNESGFKIEQSTNSTTFAQIGTVAANIKSYSNTGLNGSTKYYYRVRAYNSGGNSVYSNTTNATTAPAPTPTPSLHHALPTSPTPTPAAPTSLTGTAASSSQINLA